MGTKRSRVCVHSNKDSSFSHSNEPAYLIIPAENGIFIPFLDGYLLPTRDLDIANSLVVKDLFYEDNVLKVWNVYSNNEHSAYFLKSSFTVRCEGGYLIAFLKQNAGKAYKGNRILKSDSLAIYTFSNCGTLAISPKLAPWVERVFDTQ